MIPRIVFRASFVVLALAFLTRPTSALTMSLSARFLAGDIGGTVTDSASAQPLASAEISVMQGGVIVVNVTADAFGRYRVHNLSVGTYQIVAHFIGFGPGTRTVTLGDGDLVVDIKLTALATSLSAVQVSAAAPITVDTRSGDQVFKQDDYHGAPTNTTSQILQASIAGAARAPTGEVHIRGQHAEYTYYIDGVPVPPGISGSLNELFDPEVVNRIDFQTGGWDAEYGNRNAAIINVTTKIPSGGFHMDAGSYLGSYDGQSTVGPKDFGGQSLSMSTNSGPWGFFISGARQQSDMRQEPVMFDTTKNQVINLHNSGDDYFGFGKIQYAPGKYDVFSLELNASQTKFATPYDTSGGTFLDDHQSDQNSFANFAWHHLFGDSTSGGRAPSELFTGLFARHGGLDYLPGASDTPQFIFYPDTTIPYNLTEHRAFTTYGLKFDYAFRPARELEFKFGTQSSITTGHEDFTTVAANGSLGPASDSPLTGDDIGIYAQTAYSPVEWFELRTGARYDDHEAPFAGHQNQLSPRIRLNFFPSPATSLWLYYGRQFMPTNIEDLRSITSTAQGGTATVPTLPERDNFYEVGVTHRFSDEGVVTKLSYYHKDSSPGIDDNTVPGSNIVTDVNIANVHIQGIESVIEYHPDGPLSGYINAAINHALGIGPVTGGFFPTAPPEGYFDLDHDQRLSIVGSFTYSPNQFFLSGTVIYGSGLTNGVDPSDCGCSYGTGLFDFNRGIKVNPSTIVNASAGYTLLFGNTILRPQLYVENLLDKTYVLKGAFFSGASYGRPRSIQLRLNVGF